MTQNLATPELDLWGGSLQRILHLTELKVVLSIQEVDQKESVVGVTGSSGGLRVDALTFGHSYICCWPRDVDGSTSYSSTRNHVS